MSVMFLLIRLFRLMHANRLSSIRAVVLSLSDLLNELYRLAGDFNLAYTCQGMCKCRIGYMKFINFLLIHAYIL